MKRVLIANRGEIACRIIRSCRQLGLETVAVYSQADEQALHVANADISYCLGPSAPHESYLRAAGIIEAAKSTGADAIHPGYGFLAENSQFAEAVGEAGLIWVGPRAKTIENMGNKSQARSLAISAGVPVLPGSPGLGPNDIEHIEEEAATIGYPLLVKASAGGGGIGMQRIDGPEKLRKIVEKSQAMAERVFGDSMVFLERFVPRARHIEIQIFGFGDGRVIHLYEQECSVQRRYQKIVEESPAPNLSEETRMNMINAAISLAENERYIGAGTVEFVVDADTEKFFFLEMNTRIQVEHPVSEMINGIDLVGLQLRLARGDNLEKITQDSITCDGHAIEVRIYAENPDKMFYPSPGTLSVLEFPAADDNIRIDTGVRQGDEITVYYDPMIAKLITHGTDRRSSIERMAGALSEVRIEGLITNTLFLSQVIGHPAFRKGKVDTDFIDKYKTELVK